MTQFDPANFDPSDDEWLENELRNVPLPEGLLRRLRMSDPVGDEELDAAVRNVPIPSAMLSRMKLIPADVALDERLCDVEVSASLTARIKQVLQEVSDSDESEDAAAAISLNTDIEVKSRSSLPSRWPRWVRVAPTSGGGWLMAASLLVAAGLVVYLATVARRHPVGQGEIASHAANGTQHNEAAVTDLADDQPKSDTASDVESGLASDASKANDPTVATTVQGAIDTAPPETGSPDAVVQSESNVARADQQIAEDDATSVVDVPHLESEFEPLEPATGAQRRIIAYGSIDRVPAMEDVPRLSARGVLPPAGKAFDRLRLIHDGVNPFVALKADPRLATVQVPLASETTSFDDLRRGLRTGRLPPAQSIRTEDFLAAVRYDLPRPEETSLDVVHRGGPSPLGGGKLQLLQVALQGTDRVADRAPATDMIVAVGVTSQWDDPVRLATLRAALGAWFELLGPEDRATLVTLREPVQVLAEQVGRQNREQWREALSQLATCEAVSLPASVKEVAHLAGRESKAQDGESVKRQRVVLVTQSCGEMAEADLARIIDAVGATRSNQTAWDVIDLSGRLLDDRAAIEKRLKQVAAAGGGSVWHAEDRRDIVRAMSESLLSRPTTVAQETRLTVVFNPQTVVRYRLIGHEASAVAGLVAGPLEANFHVGETSTALFEIELKPAGGDEIGWSKVTWRDPGTNQHRQRRRNIVRSQFAASFNSSAPSLQMAVIAAGCAEVLRHSPYVGGPGGLARVLALAERMEPELQANRSFVDFLQVVDQARRRPGTKPVEASEPRAWWWRQDGQ